MRCHLLLYLSKLKDHVWFTAIVFQVFLILFSLSEIHATINTISGFPLSIWSGMEELSEVDLILSNPYGTDCMKPFCPPDRWDDVDSNGAWDDAEPYQDLNGNGSYDPGEPYTDVNGNSVWNDAEFYHPAITGFRSPDDVGSNITLMLLSSAADWGMFWYYAVDFGPINTGDPIHTGADSYRTWIAEECEPYIVNIGDGLQIEPGNMVGPTNQGLTDLIDQDPNAYWNEVTGTVEGSLYGSNSPRIIRIPVFDPTLGVRIDISGRTYLTVSQILLVFVEENIGGGDIVVRFMEILTPPNLGDANGDGIVNLGDIIYLLNYLYKSVNAPEPFYAGDVNCDGVVDLGDVVYLLNFLFKGGPPPRES